MNPVWNSMIRSLSVRSHLTGAAQPSFSLFSTQLVPVLLVAVSAFTMGCKPEVDGSGEGGEIITVSAKNVSFIVAQEGTAYDFGNLGVGTIKEKTFTVANLGNGTGTISSVALTGSTFTLSSNECDSKELTADTTCTFKITYSPTSVASHTGEVNITYIDTAVSGAEEKDFTIGLTGSAVQGLSGSVDTYSSVSDLPAASASNSGEQVIVIIQTKKIVLESDGSNWSPVSDSALAILTALSTNPHDFGNVTIGDTSSATFTVKNTGGLSASAVNLSLAGTGEFTLSSDTCTGSSVSANGTCTFQIDFEPTGAGAQADLLTISYNDGLNATSTLVNLAGTGTAGGGTPAQLIISDGTTYDFENVQQGGSQCHYFTVTNASPTQATVLTEDATEALAAPFGFLGGSYPGTGGTCGSALNAYSSCSIRVCFSPTSSGLSSDQIVLSFNNGTGTTESRRDIQGTGVSITKIATGAAHTCAALSSGIARCWGKNADGEVGNADKYDDNATDPLDNNGDPIKLTSAPSWADEDTPVTVYGLDGSDVDSSVISIAPSKYYSSGTQFTCAVTQSGKVKCWGKNSLHRYELGRGDDNSNHYYGAPMPVMDSDGTSELSGASEVSVGHQASCALLQNGGIKCWGYNNAGTLGDGTNTSRGKASYVTGIDGSEPAKTAIDVSVGRQTACAVMLDGSVKCWGDGDVGQLGNGFSSDSSVPVTVTGITTAVQVSTSGKHSCARLDSGAVKCWGEKGALGTGTSAVADNNSYNTPQDFGSIDASGGNDSKAVDLSAGTAYNGVLNTCAVTLSGKLFCAGNNLGQGTGKPPVEYNGLSDVQSVAINNTYCVVKTNGDVLCWGITDSGQTGTGVNLSAGGTVASPTAVSGLVPP